MSDSKQAATAAGAATKYPPYPDNPFYEETRGDIDAGAHQAVCKDYAVVENHKRYRYGTTEFEEADFVSFLFEVTARPFKGKRIASSMMCISMFRKSKLYGFLSGWLGREPEPDFQAQSFVGATATITVGVFPGTKNPDIKFARIAAIAPGQDTDDSQEGKTA
jgi:hypothetical protein